MDGFFVEKIKIMPHSNEHTKTKEGYLIEVEERLGLSENLPKEFYRLKIDQAEELLNSVILSGRSGFEFTARQYGLNTARIK